MVIAFHLRQSEFLASVPLLGRLSSLFVFGQTGVDLFFVLSGFLITRILISTRGHDGYFWKFYGRRMLRIFPLYYLGLVIAYFAIPAVSNELPPPASEQWWYWLYLQNIPDTFPIFSASGPNHFWSLAVEEHFYLVWPALVWMVPTERLPRMSLALIALAIGVRIGMLALGYEVFYFTLCRIDALAMGTLLATLEPGMVAKPITGKWLGAIALLVFFILAGLWPWMSGTRNVIIQAVKFTGIAFVYFGFIGFLFCCGERGIGRFFCSRPLVFAGTISYGLYVYHPFCFQAFETSWRQPSGVTNAILVVALTFLVATVSFYGFEKQFLRLKRFMSYAVIRPRERLTNRIDPELPK